MDYFWTFPNIFERTFVISVTVSLWVAIDVSVEVVGDAGMDGVSEWSGVWLQGGGLQGGICTKICMLDPF